MKGWIFINTVKDVFNRIDLGQIRQFLLFGVDEFVSEKLPYMERLNKASECVYSRLKRLCLDENGLNEATAEVLQAFSAYEAVYMELGMKAGARLIYQLLLTDDRSIIEKV